MSYKMCHLNLFRFLTLFYIFGKLTFLVCFLQITHKDWKISSKAIILAAAIVYEWCDLVLCAA